MESKKKVQTAHSKEFICSFSKISPNRQTISISQIKKMNKSLLVLPWHGSALAGKPFAGHTQRLLCVTGRLQLCPGRFTPAATPTPVVSQSPAARLDSRTATCTFLNLSGRGTKSVLASQTPASKKGPLQSPRRNATSDSALCLSDPRS